MKKKQNKPAREAVDNDKIGGCGPWALGKIKLTISEVKCKFCCNFYKSLQNVSETWEKQTQNHETKNIKPQLIITWNLPSLRSCDHCARSWLVFLVVNLWIFDVILVIDIVITLR